MSDPNPQMPAATVTVDESLLSYTHVMYALHSLAVLIGVRAGVTQPPGGGRLLPASFGSRTVYLTGRPVGLPSS